MSIEWTDTNAAVPDPFTARAHEKSATRSRSGARSFRVTRRGRAAVNGAALLGDAEPTAENLAAVAAVASAPRDAAGRIDAAYLDKVATLLTGIDLVGTESMSWHRIHDGAATNRDDKGYRDVGQEGIDIDAAYAVSHVNYPDIHAAAVATGYIAAEEYAATRDAVRGFIRGGSSRRLPARRARVLRTPRPRVSDIDAGIAYRMEIRDKNGRATTIPRFDERRGVDGVTRLVAPWIDASRVWYGHRLVTRGATNATRKTSRRVVPAVALPSRDDYRVAIIDLAAGDRVSYSTRHENGDAVRVTVSRTPRGYNVTYARGRGANRVTARRVTRDAARAVAAVARLARLMP